MRYPDVNKILFILRIVSTLLSLIAQSNPFLIDWFLSPVTAVTVRVGSGHSGQSGLLYNKASINRANGCLTLVQ